MNWLDSTATGTGLFGIALATALVLLAFAALPRGERYLARGPAVLLVLHLIVSRVEGSIDASSLGARLLSFLGAFAIFGSIARSAFLLGVMSSVARRFTRPWPRILRDLLQGFLYFGVGLLALRAAGVEPTSLLATSALLTAVIGLSLQETLGNLFAGLSLQAQPPFSVGDWLQYADGPEGIGRVIEINWRATHLVTLSEIEVIVPNGVIAKAPLKNFSRPTPLIRHTTSVVLPDSVSPQQLQELVLRLLADLPGVLPTPAPSILVGPFVERGASYSIRYFVDDFARIELSDGELRKRLWYALRRAQLELPVTRSRVEAVAIGALPTSLRDLPTQSAEEPLDVRLSRVDFLAGVAPDVLARLGPGTSLAVYAPGEAIIRAGEVGSELYVIERGTVEVLARRGDGIDTRVASLGPGQFFGEAALLAEELRSATVLASSECQLIVITRAALRAAVELDRSIAERLTSRLTSRLNELDQALSSERGDDLDEERRSLQLIDRVRRFFA
ncbi:MAG TPA: mechanosensitive ion channel family protein [Polyangiaceae bacterium]|nr:mechanosensitive ion channel family protein [Polyangiaceae bacterium]